jgi:uncharacterized membrane protein YfcA
MEASMRALVLYSLLTTAGAVLAILVGLLVERETSEAISTVVFLCLFFANFWVSWRITCFAMDRHLATQADAGAVKRA